MPCLLLLGIRTGRWPILPCTDKRAVLCPLECVVQASATHSLVFREGIQLCLIHEISHKEVTIVILGHYEPQKEEKQLN